MIINILKFIIKAIEWILTIEFKEEDKTPLPTPIPTPTPNPKPVKPVIEEPSKPVIVPPVDITVPVVEDTYPINIVEKFIDYAQYVHEVMDFNQIVIHHTAGGSAQSTINWWNSNKERVATHFIIDRDGTIYQTIPLNGWGYHLWVNAPSNQISTKFKSRKEKYDKKALSIELASYGRCHEKNGVVYNVYNKPVKNFIKLSKPYRGTLYFEKYSSEQIKSLKKLLSFLLEKYPEIKANLVKDFSTIFEINQRALDMAPGIFTHSSYRTDKDDCYPDSDLINMLNSLHLNS